MCSPRFETLPFVFLGVSYTSICSQSSVPKLNNVSLCSLIVRASFNRVLLERFSIECRKLFENYFSFALLHSVIGSKFSRYFFNQSEVKPKPIVARACTFSRALCRLPVITSSFDWFTGLSPSFLIGQSNYFGFGFTTII